MIHNETTVVRVRRPRAITVLSVFFMFGAAMSCTASVSLLSSNTVIESMWRLNPRAHENLSSLGVGAVVLLATVSLCCLAAAIGLWTISRWGHWLAVGLIATNLIGDITNVVLGTEPRAIVGVPIAGLILAYLMSRRVRALFSNNDLNEEMPR